MSYAKLAKELVIEGENEKAIEVLDRIMTELPLSQLPWDMFMPDIIEAYLLAGDREKSMELISQMKEYYGEILEYYIGLRADLMMSADYEIQTSLGYLSRVSAACNNAGVTETGTELSDMLQTIYTGYMSKMQGMGQ